MLEKANPPRLSFHRLCSPLHGAQVNEDDIHRATDTWARVQPQMPHEVAAAASAAACQCLRVDRVDLAATIGRAVALTPHVSARLMNRLLHAGSGAAEAFAGKLSTPRCRNDTATAVPAKLLLHPISLIFLPALIRDLGPLPFVSKNMFFHQTQPFIGSPHFSPPSLPSALIFQPRQPRLHRCLRISHTPLLLVYSFHLNLTPCAVFDRAARSGVPISSRVKAALINSAVAAGQLDVARGVLRAEVGQGNLVPPSASYERLLKSSLVRGSADGDGDVAGAPVSGGVVWLLEQLVADHGAQHLSPGLHALIMRRTASATELRAVAADVSAAALWDKRLLNVLVAEFLRHCRPLAARRQREHAAWLLPLLAQVHTRQVHLSAALATQTLQLLIAAQDLRACASLHRLLQRSCRTPPLAEAMAIVHMVVQAPLPRPVLGR